MCAVNTPTFPYLPCSTTTWHLQCACDDDNTLKDLGVAAKAVTESLNDLLTKLKETQVVGDTTRSEEAYQTLVRAAESLLAASPEEMMQKARDLADVSK